MRVFCQIALILLIVCSSCNHSISANTIESNHEKRDVIDIQEYQEWVAENKTSLSVSKELDKVSFRATYVPAAFKYIAEYGDSAKVNFAIYSEFANKEFYVFTVGLTSGEGDVLKSDASKLPYDLLLDYLSFRIQNDIHLEVNGKEYPCMLADFERTYGIKPFFNVNVVFDKPLEKGDHKLVYNDKIFETGVIKLNISEQDILLVPEIKMN